MRVNNTKPSISCGGVDDCFSEDLANDIGSFTLTLFHHGNNNEKEDFPSSLMSSGPPPLKKFKLTTIVSGEKVCNGATLPKDTKENDDIQRSLVEEHIFQNGCKPEVKITSCAEMFPCSACSEVFYLKSGLESHENREIVTIRLKCEYCDLHLTFFNRCLLLKHFQEHNVIPTVVSLKNSVTFEPLKSSPTEYDYRIHLSDNTSVENTAAITSSPSPISQLTQQILHQLIWLPSFENDNLSIVSTAIQSPSSQFLALPPPPVPSDTVESPTVTSTTSAVTGAIMTVTPAEHSIKQEREEVQVPSDSNETSSQVSLPNSTYQWCSSCQKDFSNAKDFITHIKNAERNGSSHGIANTKSFLCELDGVPSNSNCGYQYHKDLFHEKCFSPPFFCPECGKSFQRWELMKIHARIRCCHFKRTIRYKCPATNVCTFSAVGSSELLQHLETQHFRHILQCGKCSNAFATDDWLLKHLSTEHKITAGTGTDDEISISKNKLIAEMTKKLIQCLICRVVFCTIADYRVHLKSKLSSHCISGIFFGCDTCPMVFSSGQTLCVHNRRNHPTSEPIPLNSKPQPEEVVSELLKNDEGIRIVNLNDLIDQDNPPENLDDTLVQRKDPPPNLPSKRKLDGEVIPRKLPIIDVVDNSTEIVPNADLNSVKVKNRRIQRPLQRCKYCPRRSTPKAILNHEEGCPKNPLISLGLIKVETDEYECKNCDLKFKNTETLNLHKCHSGHQIQVKSEIVSPMPIEDSPSDKSNASPKKSLSATDSNSTKAFTCTLCSEKEFHSKNGLKKHVRLHHKDVDFDSVDWSAMTRDPVAATVWSRRQRLARRLRLRPREAPSKLENFPKNKKRTRISPSEPDERLSLKIEPGSVKSLRPPKTVESQRMESKARLLDGTFKCIKCPDTPPYSTELLFFEHVKLEHVLKNQITHSEDCPEFYKDYVHNGFYCPECGMEFVVKPTLIKHLVCAHEFIPSADKYLDSIGYGVKPMKPLKENQCEVCRYQCEDAMDYEKHIRTHGMAFLRLRQQRKSNESN